MPRHDVRPTARDHRRRGEVGIAPGMELRGAAQRLTGADAATALLGVMDDEHGNVMPALQLAQVGEQRGDFAAGVFVDAVETYERIEDEQARLQSGDGLGEVAAVGIQIEPEGGRGDDLDVEIGQRHTGCCRDAFEASAHDVQCVLGGKQQDATGTRHGEAAQTWDAGGDRDGEVQGQERLAALWLAADDADRLLGPQAGDQPTMFLRALGETIRGFDRKQGHRRRPAVLGSATGGVAQVSRNSFSSIWRASRSAATVSNSPAMFMSARGLPWACYAARRTMPSGCCMTRDCRG